MTWQDVLSALAVIIGIFAVFALNEWRKNWQRKRKARRSGK